MHWGVEVDKIIKETTLILLQFSFVVLVFFNHKDMNDKAVAIEYFISFLLNFSPSCFGFTALLPFIPPSFPSFLPFICLLT